MIESLAFASIAALADLLRRQQVTPSELLECYAARIERFDPISKSFISLDLERARAKAASMRIKPIDNPLKGIPYACKDMFDVKAVATTAGSKLLANNIALADADVVKRMNQAGAIFIGKNNLHEFAYGATGANRLHGTAPNPYDQTRLAGGSSSGSASAVGFGLCAAAIGTDTGGSVRAPASLCGLVGFKPTFGRISMEGAIPFSWTLDHVGSLTRSAVDAELLFQALASNYRPSAGNRLEQQTIGIPENYFFEHCDAEILDRLQRLKDHLRTAGVRLKPVSMPSMEFTRTVALTVQMPEALSYHNRYLEKHGQLYSGDFRAGLALAQNLLAEHYIRSKRLIEYYRRELNHVFAKVDLLLTPATPVIAPKIDSVEESIDDVSEPTGNAITRFSSFFNLTGHPAITLPCGQHTNGLPISAQLVGKHHGDERLLETARQIESSYDFSLPLPELG